MSELKSKNLVNPKFLSTYLKPGFMIPDREVYLLSDVAVEELDEEGIEGVIFDVDNLLFLPGEFHVAKSVEPAFQRIISTFPSCIISNTDNERRAKLTEYFLENHNLYVVQSDIPKPHPEPFHEALKYLGTKPGKTAMFGDRIITDVAGANSVGLYSIKVEPLDLESERLRIRFARWLEDCCYRALTR